MKKYIFSLLTICTTHMNIESIHLEPLTRYQKIAPMLSIDQLLLLNYIQEKLNLYAPIATSQWNSNENLQILIEGAELAVQQSTPGTQELLKSRIIEIFQDFDIDITFTTANSIRLKTYTFDDHDNQYARNIAHKKALRTKKDNQHMFFSTSRNLDRRVQPKALPRIHGARRTMNRLKKQREERAKKEKEEEQQARNKRLLERISLQEKTSLNSKPAQEELIQNRLHNIEFFKEMMAQREPSFHQGMSPEEFTSQEG